MDRPAMRGHLLLAGMSALLLSVLLPAHAGYDKLYRFRNRTGSGQTGCFVVLNALEVIGAQYTVAPPDGHNHWGPATAGVALIGGVYCTTLDWDADPDVTVPGDGSKDSIVKIGWNTADHSCRLRSLNWGHDASGAAISDPNATGDVPGGGGLRRQGNNYVWTVVNDTPGTLRLTDVELGTFDNSLSMDDLAEVAASGVVGRWISILRRRLGGGNAGFARRARNENTTGFEAWANGDRQQARGRWNQALAQMRRLQNVPPALANRVQRLTAALQRQPAFEERPPGLPNSLPPRGTATVTIPTNQVPVGGSAVMHGQVLDSQNRVVLDWVDQAEIKSDLEPPTASTDIQPAPNAQGVHTPNELGANEVVTLTLRADDASGIQGYVVAVNGAPAPGAARRQPGYFTGATATLTFGRDEAGEPVSGEWEVQFRAIDREGNASDQQTVKIKIEW
jgi:hypothetical protein